MSWTDDRMDDLKCQVDELSRRMDDRFGQIEQRMDTGFRELNQRMGAMQRTMIMFGAAMFAAMLGLVATQLGLILTQL